MTRILAHIHTMNDRKVIGRSVAAVRQQSRPVDGVLIVDNGSTDGTVEQPFGDDVTVIEHGRNLGTSGSVHTGLAYALEHGYDWLWVFDADSAPHPNALARLLEFYESLPAAERDQVHRLTSLAKDLSTGGEIHGFSVSDRGFGPATPAPGGQPYECIGTIWSGSLFRMNAVRATGLPNPDYMLDWAEVIYGYHAATLGFRTIMVPASRMDHNIDTEIGAAAKPRRVTLGPIRFTVLELAPFRIYYFVRNDLYFWTRESGRRGFKSLKLLRGWMWIPKMMIKFALLGRWAEIDAVVRGVRDGLLGRLDRRYL